SLLDTMKSLGVINAFEGAADFSGIDGARDLYVSKAVHKAAVEVDETGAKAAAATGIAVSVYSNAAYGPPEIPIPFYADHPFHFLIRDRQTNSILFLGQVQKPSAYVGSDQTATELPKTDLPVTP